ncbi:hypothetical protein V6N13_111849 [Hibiscus sabdariffa]
MPGGCLSASPVFVTAVYASPRATLRKFLWAKLTSLNPGSEHAWLLDGDFNTIFDSMDRMGGAHTQLGISRGIRNISMRVLEKGGELILSEPCVRRVENGVGNMLAFDRLRPLTTHHSLPPRVLLVLSMLFEIASSKLMIVTYKALLLG